MTGRFESMDPATERESRFDALSGPAPQDRQYERQLQQALSDTRKAPHIWGGGKATANLAMTFPSALAARSSRGGLPPT